MREHKSLLKANREESHGEITKATEPLDHAELRLAIDSSYQELLTSAALLVHKRRSWLKNSSKLQLAENIVQEALQRAWKNATAFDPARRPIAWLMGYVMNVAAEELRAERKAPVRATDLDSAWDQALGQIVNRDDSSTELMGLLRQAWSKLSPEQQRILRLHYEENLTGMELAKRLGLPSSGAARVAKFRALGELRTIFLKMLDGGQEENV